MKCATCQGNCLCHLGLKGKAIDKINKIYANYLPEAQSDCTWDSDTGDKCNKR